MIEGEKRLIGRIVRLVEFVNLPNVYGVSSDRIVFHLEPILERRARVEQIVNGARQRVAGHDVDVAVVVAVGIVAPVERHVAAVGRDDEKVPLRRILHRWIFRLRFERCSLSCARPRR